MTTTDTQSLHATYQRLTGMDVPYSMQRHYSWELWLVNKFTQSDLETVVRLIRKRIQEKRRRPEALKFHNLIQNTELFGEDLAEAKAEFRKPVETARSRIMEQTGRPLTTQPEARSAAQILAAEKAFEQFREMKGRL